MMGEDALLSLQRPECNMCSLDLHIMQSFVDHGT